jgi:hypothetical protein
LVTLFIAAAFLTSGYQLFNAIIRDSGKTRAQSNASNTAYNYLQIYKKDATSPCSVKSLSNNSQITVASLSNVRLSASISCPYGTTSTLSKIQVTITYNNPKQTVSQAIYVKK